jgi:hypothetical protein
MSWLTSVQVATGPNDAPLTLLGGLPVAPPLHPAMTIDGIPWGNLAVGQRILILNQNAFPAFNGVWVYQGPGNAMARPVTPGDYVQGTFIDNETVVRVSQGATLQHSEWACTSPNAVQIGTANLTFQNTVTGNSSALALTSGVNADIPVVGATSVISAPGAFSISGVAGGWDGREVTLINPTGCGMTINHEDPTNPNQANIIMCQGGTDLYLPAQAGGFSWCKLKYSTCLPGGAPMWLAMGSSPPAPLGPWQFLPQVVLSLRSDLGISLAGTTVTAWADQSGAGNSVAAAATGGPTYNPSGGPNGYPTLSGFANNTTYLDSATNLVPSGADRTVLFVGQATTLGGDYFTFRRGTTGGTVVSGFMYANLGGVCFCWTDAVTGTSNEIFAPASFVASTPVIIVAIYHQGALLGLRLNGAPLTVVSGGSGLTAETGPAGFSVGVSEAFSTPAWDGYILEQHVCATQLTTAQCAQFETYASARYGIAIT